MRHPFFKIILGGLLLAPVLFLLSFIVLRVAIIMLIGGALYRLFARPRGYHYANYQPAFAQRQHESVGDERFQHFKTKFQERYDAYPQQNDYRIVIK